MTSQGWKYRYTFPQDSDPSYYIKSPWQNLGWLQCLYSQFSSFTIWLIEIGLPKLVPVFKIPKTAMVVRLVPVLLCFCSDTVSPTQPVLYFHLLCTTMSEITPVDFSVRAATFVYSSSISAVWTMQKSLACPRPQSYNTNRQQYENAPLPWRRKEPAKDGERFWPQSPPHTPSEQTGNTSSKSSGNEVV